MIYLRFRGLEITGWAKRIPGTRYDPPDWDVGIESIAMLDWDMFSGYGLLEKLSDETISTFQAFEGDIHPELQRIILDTWEDIIMEKLAICIP